MNVILLWSKVIVVEANCTSPKEGTFDLGRAWTDFSWQNWFGAPIQQLKRCLGMASDLMLACQPLSPCEAKQQPSAPYSTCLPACPGSWRDSILVLERFDTCLLPLPLESIQNNPGSGIWNSVSYWLSFPAVEITKYFVAVDLEGFPSVFCYSCCQASSEARERPWQAASEQRVPRSN